MIQRLLRQAVLAATLLLSPAVFAVPPAAPVAAAHPVPVTLPGAHPPSTQPGPTPTEGLRLILRTGTITATDWNQRPGLHPSRFITVQQPDGGGTLRAIVKGELPEPGYGPTYLREAAASHLAEHFGIDAVPPTTRRVVDGQNSSVQLIIGGAKSVHDLAQSGQPIPQLDRAVAEKLRVFDYVIGNRDRHGNNMLVRDQDGKATPIAIDNGLAFPEGPVPIEHFAWPTRLVASQTGPLLPETKSFISGMDLGGVAQVLQKSGISREAVIHTLRRIERVKQDPGFLELQPADISSSGEYSSAELTRVGKMGTVADQGLAPPVLKHINDVVDSVFGKPN